MPAPGCDVPGGLNPWSSSRSPAKGSSYAAATSAAWPTPSSKPPAPSSSLRRKRTHSRPSLPRSSPLTWPGAACSCSSATAGSRRPGFYDDGFWGGVPGPAGPLPLQQPQPHLRPTRSPTCPRPIPSSSKSPGSPQVRPVGFTPEQRSRHLEMLIRIAGETRRRGLHFTFGVWSPARL